MITALVLISIVLVISGAIMSSLSKMSFYGSGVKNFGLSIDVAQKQILTILESDAAWARTIALNAGMACLSDAVTNCSNVYQDFSLYLPDGTLFLQNAGGIGFTKRGYRCQTYDSGAGDSSCVYKIKLRWRCLDAVCASATAKSTRISVSMSHYHSIAGDGYPTERMLSQLYNEVLRGRISGSIKSSCTALGGALEEAGTHCRIFPQSNVDCLATSSRHMVDRVQGGVVNCVNPVGFGDGTNPFVCNPGSAITGFLGDHPACDVF
jgi:hypothetical protein